MSNNPLRHTFQLLALAGVFLLSACGQKGPLYLPGNPSEMKTEVPKEQAPEDDNKNEDDEKPDENPD